MIIQTYAIGIQINDISRNFWPSISDERNEYAKFLWCPLILRYMKGLYTILLKILTAAKLATNFQSWVQNHRFFAVKSKILRFSKNFFCIHVVPLETYKMYSNKVLVRSTIWPGEQKVVFVIFRGLKRGRPPLSPPRRHSVRNFFCHNLGLG